METGPDPWIDALRHSHDRLQALVGSLDVARLEQVSLTESNGEDGLPELRLPAEAFVRLVYGRLGPHHTPPVEADGVDLDELRQLFPGF
jgi:hypothetical protein